ncbi:uncharacterized protein LOC143997503 [Lithobates pipiens]
MNRGLTIFILLSLGVAAQTATTTVVLQNDVDTQVSVDPSQVQTTQIVSRQLIFTPAIPLRVAITAQSNATACTALSIDPCPPPQLLVTVSSSTNYNSTTNTYSKTVTGGVQLLINITSNGINFDTKSFSAAGDEALLYLDYYYTGSRRSLSLQGNSSNVNFQLVTATTATVTLTGGSGNGQPALYHRILLGIVALMLLPLFLPSRLPSGPVNLTRISISNKYLRQQRFQLQHRAMK